MLVMCSRIWILCILRVRDLVDFSLQNDNYTTHFRKLVISPYEFLVKRGTLHAEEIFCLCTLWDDKTANYSRQKWTIIIVCCDEYRQIHLIFIYTLFPIKKNLHFTSIILFLYICSYDIRHLCDNCKPS